MDEMRTDKPTGPDLPVIVELVGLAGSGKTTLSRALKQGSEKIQIGAEIELRELRHIPVFFRNTPPLLPVILHRRRSGRRFTWEEIKYLVYLNGWPRVLGQQATCGSEAILLDHGPVFKLATLNAFGPEYLRTAQAESWWKAMFRQWASTVDIVVWLDAPDSILEQRINSRNQRHAVKGKTEAEVRQFLARYRMSYQEILAKLITDGAPALFQFDTSQTTIEQVAEEVLLTIAASLRGTSRRAGQPDRQNIIFK
jgi:shikimate kinase